MTTPRSRGWLFRRLGGKLKDRILDTTLRYRRPLIVVVHVALFACANALAFGLRFDLDVPPERLNQFLLMVPVIVLIRAAAFWRWHLYQGLWRYVSVRDGVEILKGVTTSSVVFAVFVLFA
ncbi:MAG: hypothetical protein WD826_00375, partial [Actinomycetota bacterium]